MRGIIMETKNGRAVLLTKGGEFVNIKNKGYLAGDKVNITSNTGRLCAMAASLVIVCAGIGSYFVPAGYVSVDINPSLMITLNMYNRVIDVTSFNDDARALLHRTDIKGKSAEKSVEMLIEVSEEIGYINDNNKDVILEVVPGISNPDMDGIMHKNIEITNEIADRETLRIAQDIGVSMAKVKAIEEYTEKNGGDMRSNAAKFNDKSVKEIRNIMLDNNYLPDKRPSEVQKTQEIRNENISEPPKPLENYKPAYKANNSSFSAGESKYRENVLPPANQMQKNEYRPSENIAFQRENKQIENLPVFREQPLRNIKQLNPALPLTELNSQKNVSAQGNDILQNKPLQTNETENEKQPADVKPIQTEQKPQNNISDKGGSKPQNKTPRPSQPKLEDKKPSDNGQQMIEQKPQESIPSQDGETVPDKPMQAEGQNPDIIMPSDNQTKTEQKQNIPEHGKQQDKPTVHDKFKPEAEPDSHPSEPDNNINKPQSSEPKQEHNIPPKAEPQPDVPMQNPVQQITSPQCGHNESREMP